MTAVGLDALSRVLGMVGVAGTDPAAWQTVMAELTTCLDATACTVALGVGASRTVLASDLTAEAVEPYLEHYRRQDYIMALCDATPVGLVHGGWNVVRANLRSQFYNEWQLRFGITDGLAVRLATPTPASLVISAPRRDEPFATAERSRFVDALTGHLQRALIDRDLLSGWPSTAAVLGGLDAVGAAADALVHGIVAIDGRGRVAGTNTAARAVITAGDGLFVRAAILRATASPADQRLRAAIMRAATATTALGGVGVVCPRPSGRRALVVHVLPVGFGLDGGVRAAAIIVDPERRSRPAHALLQDLFGLTPAESRIAAHLLDGLTVTEAAAAAQVSVSTVKTHLQQLYRKTGTTRQAELLRVLQAAEP